MTHPDRDRAELGTARRAISVVLAMCLASCGSSTAVSDTPAPASADPSVARAEPPLRSEESGGGAATEPTPATDARAGLRPASFPDGLPWLRAMERYDVARRYSLPEFRAECDALGGRTQQQQNGFLCDLGLRSISLLVLDDPELRCEWTSGVTPGGTGPASLGDEVLAAYYSEILALNEVVLANGEQAFSPQGAIRVSGPEGCWDEIVAGRFECARTIPSGATLLPGRELVLAELPAVRGVGMQLNFGELASSLSRRVSTACQP